MHKQVTGIFFLVGLALSAWGQGAAGGGAGGGGGGGGSNLYTFRYILLSKKPVKAKTFSNDKSLDRAYSIVQTVRRAKGNRTKSRQYYYQAKYYVALTFLDNVINNILLWSLKISRTDVVNRRVHRSIRKPSTKMSYFLTRSTSDPTKIDTTYILSTSATGDTMIIETHRILYDQIIPYHRLSLYILGRNQDTLMFEIWPRAKRLQNENYNGQSTVVAGVRNGDLYNHGTTSADTLYATIPWRNHGVGPKFQTFNVMFATHYLIPITVPIAYAFYPKTWQTSFLNAGMAYGWAIGRTKFYRDGLQPSRNFYWGAGLLAGVSSVTVSATSVNPAFKPTIGSNQYTLPGVYAGAHVGLSFNSVQFMLTGTYDWAIGSNSSQWIYQHRFSLGIAIGLSSFNLAVPASTSAALGH